LVHSFEEAGEFTIAYVEFYEHLPSDLGSIKHDTFPGVVQYSFV